jgi:23S rRNA (pseudouridine1915-N3)-methyltransferase
MRINIIAVGKKMPEWVVTAYEEFAVRFPRDYKIKLLEISPAKRSSSKNVQQLLEEEALQILKAVPAKSQTIALEVKGELWSTEQLAKNLSLISTEGFAINFLIGGPDGLSESCLIKSRHRLSISRLTFPHALVRVILIEQLYRAQSILSHHPYHRE